MTAGPTSIPSAAIPAADWAAAQHAVVDTLRDLIRIPSVNPPDPTAPNEETRAARYLEWRLRAMGVAAEAPAQCLVDKHYHRKHGRTAYYGQK